MQTRQFLFPSHNNTRVAFMVTIAKKIICSPNINARLYKKVSRVQNSLLLTPGHWMLSYAPRVDGRYGQHSFPTAHPAQRLYTFEKKMSFKKKNVKHAAACVFVHMISNTIRGRRRQWPRVGHLCGVLRPHAGEDTCTYTYIHKCIHAYMHTHIHACIHTYIHTHA